MMDKRIGIGLRQPHYQQILETLPEIGWLEVHSENYFDPHGLGRYYLEQLSEHYPISLHGIGMSLGSADPLNHSHLNQLKQLIELIQPFAVSEHLSWGSIGGRYFNDLLPIPYTREALNHFCAYYRDGDHRII